MINLEKFIAELSDLNMKINEAYRGIRFLSSKGFHEESDEYAKKHEELLRQKELLLKPIFGA